ncbi:TPA: hypothetical protein HA246_03605 [Candidatus Woesearchaeota archaeon]|nr:hypothetical protein [Candidatus Woesearchaeota archaeon]
MTNRLHLSRIAPSEKTLFEKVQAIYQNNSLDDIAGSAPQNPAHANSVERIYHVPDLLVYILEGESAELYRVTFSRTSDGNPRIIAGKPVSIATKETMLDVKGDVVFETLSATDGKFEYDDNFRKLVRDYVHQNNLALYEGMKDGTDSPMSADDIIAAWTQFHYTSYKQHISKAQSGDNSSQAMHQGIDALDENKHNSETLKSGSDTPTQNTITPEKALTTSLADRIKGNPAKPSKDGPRLTDLYVNIRGKHYFLEFSRFEDGSPFMYEDEITGLVMPMGMFYVMPDKDTRLLLGDKVYAHVENIQPNAGPDFDFYLKLEQLNENPDLSISVIGDEHSTDTEILKRELYNHLRKYREDVIAASSAPKKAPEVITNGNPLSIYNPSAVKGFDWHESAKFDWKAAWKKIS